MLIPCSIFHFCLNLARHPRYVYIMGQLDDFFMAGQDDFSAYIQATCIQVTFFFPLGVQLASKYVKLKKCPVKYSPHTNSSWKKGPNVWYVQHRYL